MPRNEAFVLDMLIAARHARSFLAGMDRSKWLRDLKTQSAVLYQLTVLGEAARRVDEEFRARYPNIPWRDVAGTRDRIIHQYDRVDLKVVWGIVDKDLAELIPLLEAIVPQGEQ